MDCVITTKVERIGYLLVCLSQSLHDADYISSSTSLLCEDDSSWMKWQKREQNKQWVQQANSLQKDGTT